MKKLPSSILNNIYLFILVTAPIYFIPLYKMIVLHQVSYVRFKIEGELLNLSFFIVFILISSFFSKKVFKTILVIATILMALIIFVEIETIFFLDRYFATDVMYDILATNKRESKEFIHTIFSIKMVMKQVALIVSYIVYCLIAIYLITKIKIPQTRCWKWTSLILLLIFPIYHASNYKRTIKRMFPQNTLMFILNGLSGGKLLLTKDNKNISTDYTAVADQTHRKKIVVFVLGESQTRNHLGLYGYHRNTTPLLQKLHDNNQLFVFNDVITSEPATAISMTNIFLTQGYETRPNINIMAMFNKAGFKNYYIENQYVKYPTTDTVFNNSKKNATFRFYGFQIITNTMKYLSNRYMAPNAEYDKAVLHSLDSMLQKKDDRIFMVIHLQGSHFHYQTRYPKNFPAYTKPLKILAEMDKKSYSQFGSHVLSVNQYDTSTRYTDYVLNEIIKKISTTKNHEQYEISILYAPDHGEATARTGNGDHVGHGTNVDKDIYEIPLIFWSNKTFQQNNPQIIQTTKANLNAPYMTDQIGFSLFQLAGINIYHKDKPVDIQSKSIFSPTLNVHRIRKIGFRSGIPQGKNYDTTLKLQKDIYK